MTGIFMLLHQPNCCIWFKCFTRTWTDKTKKHRLVHLLKNFSPKSYYWSSKKTTVQNIRPKLWIRKGYDNLVISKPSSIEVIYKKTSSKHTVILENNKKLDFLHVQVDRNAKGTLEMTVYRRLTHAGQVLMFHTNQPNKHKMSSVGTTIPVTYYTI